MKSLKKAYQKRVNHEWGHVYSKRNICLATFPIVCGGEKFTERDISGYKIHFHYSNTSSNKGLGLWEKNGTGCVKLSNMTEIIVVYFIHKMAKYKLLLTQGTLSLLPKSLQAKQHCTRCFLKSQIWILTFNLRSASVIGLHYLSQASASLDLS